MQCAMVEFAQNVLGMDGASSTEVNKDSPYPVIDLMEDQKGVTKKGGTMRLGAYDCELSRGSHSHKAYKSLNISERHRHRFEFNNYYAALENEKGCL